MSGGAVLYGYGPSIYTRIARLALAEAAIACRFRHVDPFDGPFDAALNPFRRVPILDHAGLRLYETRAITRYVAALAPQAALVPGDPARMARMEQVIGLLDAYGYWPMVRQVHAHGVLRPAQSDAQDAAQVDRGLAAAEPVLAELDRIAAEGLVLAGPWTLADIHLAPMLDAFAAHHGAAARLDRYRALLAWWAGARVRAAVVGTPLLPEPT